MNTFKSTHRGHQDQAPVMTIPIAGLVYAAQRGNKRLQAIFKDGIVSRFYGASTFEEWLVINQQTGLLAINPDEDRTSILLTDQVLLLQDGMLALIAEFKEGSE